MTQVPNQQRFSEAYSGEAPWDIGRPQDAFVAVAERVVSPVLDAGCGTGETALFFAERGHRVVGIDFLEEPIRRAQAKVAERGLAVDFRVADALALEHSDERFATVIDSGLFHVFTDEDRRRYVRGLTHVVKPDGLLFLMCFSDAEPPGQGPRRITRQELVDTFADGWEVESVEPMQFAINPKFSGVDSFTPGGPKAWFAIVRRKA
jgi:cyclopropane fatty-acyl-phospholipid synthase-like methyltransferase